MICGGIHVLRLKQRKGCVPYENCLAFEFDVLLMWNLGGIWVSCGLFRGAAYYRRCWLAPRSRIWIDSAVDYLGRAEVSIQEKGITGQARRKRL